MPKFSTKSERELFTCHMDLQRLFDRVVEHFDCSVLCGYRGEQEQNELFRTGKSQLKYPESKHNKSISQAIDVAPYPINWSDRERFYYFAGFVQGVASLMNIKIRSGADWDMDTMVDDQTFFDLVHFELA